jgi:pimeloyl-ACP methyl ester carboxylesterase
MRQATVNIGGHELHYEYGRGDDPAIVCIPGGSCNSTDFRGIVEHLGRTNVFAVDVWGHGRSPWIGDYSQARDTVDIAEFLAAVSGPAVLVGFSRGELISFELAAGQPSLVRGVYAIDVTPFFNENPKRAEIPFLGAVAGLDRVVRPFREQSRSFKWLLDAVGDMPVAQDSTLRQLLPADVLVDWARQLADCDPEMWPTWRTRPAARPRSSADIFGAVRCPLHVAYADTEHGSVVMAGEADRFVAASALALATAFPGHVHAIHQQSPAVVAEDLRRFLAAHGL